MVSLVFLVSEIMALIGVALVHFLPTAIAAQRNHSDTMEIFLVNLLFGRSLLGWIAVLVGHFRSSREV